jgi:hypothetical protein
MPWGVKIQGNQKINVTVHASAEGGASTNAKISNGVFQPRRPI